MGFFGIGALAVMVVCKDVGQLVVDLVKEMVEHLIHGNGHDLRDHAELHIIQRLAHELVGRTHAVELPEGWLCCQEVLGSNKAFVGGVIYAGLFTPIVKAVIEILAVQHLPWYTVLQQISAARLTQRALVRDTAKIQMDAAGDINLHVIMGR